MRILIADELSLEARAIPGARVDLRPGLAPDALAERSATSVTAALLAAAP